MVYRINPRDLQQPWDPSLYEMGSSGAIPATSVIVPQYQIAAPRFQDGGWGAVAENFGAGLGGGISKRIKKHFQDDDEVEQKGSESSGSMLHTLSAGGGRDFSTGYQNFGGGRDFSGGMHFAGFREEGGPVDPGTFVRVHEDEIVAHDDKGNVTVIPPGALGPDMERGMQDNQSQAAELERQRRHAAVQEWLARQPGPVNEDEVRRAQMAQGNGRNVPPMPVVQPTAVMPVAQDTQETQIPVRPSIPLPDRRILDTAIDRYSRVQGMSPEELDRLQAGGDPNDPMSHRGAKDKWYKNIFNQLRLAGPQISAVAMDPNLSDKRAFGMAAGYAIGRGLSGVVNPRGDEQEMIDREKVRAFADVKASQGIYDANMDAAKSQAQIQNYRDVAEWHDKTAATAATKEARQKQQAQLAILYKFHKQLTDNGQYDPDSTDPKVAAASQSLAQAIDKAGGIPPPKGVPALGRYEKSYDATSQTYTIDILDKQGQLIDHGLLMSDGRLTQDPAQAGKFKTERIGAEEVRAASNKYRADLSSETTKFVAKLKADTATKLGEWGIQAGIDKHDQDQVLALALKEMPGGGDPELADESDYDTIYESYANSLGIKVDALTDDGKAEAIQKFWNAAVEHSKNKVLVVKK